VVCAEFLKQDKVLEIRSTAQEAKIKLIRVLRDNLNTLKNLALLNGKQTIAFLAYGFAKRKANHCFLLMARFN